MYPVVSFPNTSCTSVKPITCSFPGHQMPLVIDQFYFSTEVITLRIFRNTYSTGQTAFYTLYRMCHGTSVFSQVLHFLKCPLPGYPLDAMNTHILQELFMQPQEVFLWLLGKSFPHRILKALPIAT